jgi:hypothetical protein
MKARDLVFVAIVVVVVGGLFLLSRSGRVKPLPANPQHLNAKTRGDCLACHLPQTLASLEQAHKHPGKWRDERVSCLQCHTAPTTNARALAPNAEINFQTAQGQAPEEKPWRKQKPE